MMIVAKFKHLKRKHQSPLMSLEPLVNRERWPRPSPSPPQRPTRTIREIIVPEPGQAGIVEKDSVPTGTRCKVYRLNRPVTKEEAELFYREIVEKGPQVFTLPPPEESMRGESRNKRSYKLKPAPKLKSPAFAEYENSNPDDRLTALMLRREKYYYNRRFYGMV